MKTLRVDLDTWVIGGCFDAEFPPWSRRLMQDFRIGTLIAVLSTVLAAEIEDAPGKVTGAIRGASDPRPQTGAPG